MPKIRKTKKENAQSTQDQKSKSMSLLGNEEYIGKVVAFLKGSGRYNEL